MEAPFRGPNRAEATPDASTPAFRKTGVKDGGVGMAKA